MAICACKSRSVVRSTNDGPVPVFLTTPPVVSLAPIVQEPPPAIVQDAGADLVPLTDAGADASPSAKKRVGTKFDKSMIKEFAQACVYGCLDGEEDNEAKLRFCVCACAVSVKNILKKGYTVEEAPKALPKKSELDQCFRMATAQDEETVIQ